MLAKPGEALGGKQRSEAGFSQEALGLGKQSQRMGTSPCVGRNIWEISISSSQFFYETNAVLKFFFKFLKNKKHGTLARKQGKTGASHKQLEEGGLEHGQGSHWQGLTNPNIWPLDWQDMKCVY